MIDASAVSAVIGHMNGDHSLDNLLIVQAFGCPEATSATMTGLDANAGFWRAVSVDGERDVSVAWPNAPISERAQVRREVVLLYRAACKSLGFPAREEHPRSSDQSRHGRLATDAGDVGFARRIREATWGDHSDSEGAEFMSDIMRGRGTEADYAQLAAQHWFIYDALECAAAELSADTLLSELHPQQLHRLEPLQRDLLVLMGSQWRACIQVLPAAEAYAARIREVASQGWTAGIVAHHYTRYLGDLSGGQAIARHVSRQFGFEGAGVAFYDFAGLGDLKAFKDSYRRVLDVYGEGLDNDEQARMLDEVRLAYRFNTEVFKDLSAARAAARVSKAASGAGASAL